MSRHSPKNRWRGHSRKRQGDVHGRLESRPRRGGAHHREARGGAERGLPARLLARTPASPAGGARPTCARGRPLRPAATASPWAAAWPPRRRPGCHGNRRGDRAAQGAGAGTAGARCPPPTTWPAPEGPRGARPSPPPLPQSWPPGSSPPSSESLRPRSPAAPARRGRPERSPSPRMHRAARAPSAPARRVSPDFSRACGQGPGRPGSAWRRLALQRCALGLVWPRARLGLRPAASRCASKRLAGVWRCSRGGVDASNKTGECCPRALVCQGNTFRSGLTACLKGEGVEGCLSPKILVNTWI